MKPLPRKVRGALVVLEVGLAALIGVAAGLGALLCAATITSRPPLFVLTGLIAFCATYLLGLWLATRKVDDFRKRRVRVALFCAGTVLVAGTFAWTALIPMGNPRLPPAPVESQRFWELATGSRIAYVRVPAEGGARKTPLILEVAECCRISIDRPISLLAVVRCFWV